jgi:hypothetical protein
MALLAHLPGFFRQLYDPDEAAIATLANSVVHGGVLYRDAVDRKPPLAPLIYALSFLAAGTRDLRPLHVLVAVELGAAALVLAGEARRVTGWRAGWWAAALFIAGAVTMSPSAAQAANYSQLAVLPAVVAIVAARRGSARSAVLAGAALGVAVLTRQTWLLGIGPAMLAAWLTGGRRASRAAIVAGATIATIASVGFIVPFGAFVHWSFTANSSLLDLSGSANVGQRLWLSVSAFVLFHLVIVGLAIRARGLRAHIDLWLWTATGIVAVLAGLRFFDHYWFQVLPPLVLLAALGAAQVRLSVLAVAAALVVVPLAIQWRSAWTTERFTHNWQPLVAAIDARSKPGERIMVWGSVPELYWLSGRLPGGALIISDFVTGRSAGRPDGSQRLPDATPGALDTLLSSLKRHAPALVVDTSTAGLRGYRHYPLASVPALAAFIDNHYRPVAVIDRVTILVQVHLPKT